MRKTAAPALAAYACLFVSIAVADTLLLVVAGALSGAASRDGAVTAAMRFVGSTAGVVIGALLNASILLGIAALFARKSGGFGALALGPVRAGAAAWVASATGTIGLGLACAAAAGLLGLAHRGAMGVLEQALAARSLPALLGALLAVALGSGVAEETFFRGYMQTRLAAAWGPWPAIATAAAAFGLLHADAIQGPMAFVLGLHLGWCAHRLGGIRPAIFAHATNNAFFVVTASFGEGPEPGRGGRALALLVGAVLWAVSAVAIARAARRPTATGAPEAAVR